MRICFVNPGHASLGGAERSLTLLVGTLSERGHRCSVVLFEEGTAAAAFAGAGAEVDVIETALGSVRRHGSGWAFATQAIAAAPQALAAAAGVRRVARSFRADILHSNGYRSHMLSPMLRSESRRIVWSLRDAAPSPASRSALRLAARSVDGIAANSRYTANAFGATRAQVAVVGNPLEVGAKLDPAAARATLGLPAHRPIVSLVAHLHPSKGHHVAIEAWRQLPAENRPLLVVAGAEIYGRASVEYGARLRGQIDAAGLADDVRLLGPIEDIGLVYDAADVHLHPAIHPEGFGRAVAEAQLHGVPVVATRLGGVVELVEDFGGTLIPPNDPSAICASIAEVLGDPGAGPRARRSALDASGRHDPDRHAQAVLALYRRIGAR